MKALHKIIIVILFSLTCIQSRPAQNRNALDYQSKVNDFKHTLNQADANLKAKKTKLEEVKALNAQLTQLKESIFLHADRLKDLPQKIQKIENALTQGKLKNANLEKQLQKVRDLLKITQEGVDSIKMPLPEQQ